MLVQMGAGGERDAKVVAPVVSYNQDACPFSHEDRLPAWETSHETERRLESTLLSGGVEIQCVDGPENVTEMVREQPSLLGHNMDIHDEASDTAGAQMRHNPETNHEQNHESAPANERQRETEVSRGEPIVTSTQKRPIITSAKRIDIRLLVRRREAGALIGKRGANIKRMREIYKGSTFNIPDTGNGPERIVCISADSWASMETILIEIGRLFLDKSSMSHLGEEQVELKQLINSAYAGLLIGIGGQSIRKLRNDSKAAIKIYEMCCPLSDERVCAIKARPPVVVSTMKLIHEIMLSSETTIKAPLQAHKPYDALNFDLNLVDKYGGYLPDDCGPIELDQLRVPGGGCINGLATGNNQHQHPHLHSHQLHHNLRSTQIPPQVATSQIVHFNLIGANGEPLPLVTPQGIRPATFLPPFRQIDFVPFHPLANGRHLMPINQPSNRPRFLARSSMSTFSSQQRAPTAAQQIYRNQRFQPYSIGEGLQARLRHLYQQQNQLMLSSQLIDRMSQQISQNARSQVDQSSNIAFSRQQQQQQQQRFNSYGSSGSPLNNSLNVAGDTYNHQQQYKGHHHQQQQQSIECRCSAFKTSILPANCMETAATNPQSHKDLGYGLCRFSGGDDPRARIEKLSHQDKSHPATERHTINTKVGANGAANGPA